MSHQSVKEIEKKKAIIHAKSLLSILEGIVCFYQDAKHQVKATEVIAIFDSVSAIHKQSIHNLKTLLEQCDSDNDALSSYSFIDEAASMLKHSRTMLMSCRQGYAAVMSSIQHDSDLAYIDQLEEVEDSILCVFDRILDCDLSDECTADIEDIRRQSQLAHDAMRELQEAKES